MVHRFAAWLYTRATGRPYWTEVKWTAVRRPVDLATVVRDGLGPHLALAPIPGGWPDLFAVIHIPTGRPMFGGAGCLACCRRVAGELAAAGADWTALRVDNGPQWLAAAPDEVRRAIAGYRLGLDCPAAYGEPCRAGAPAGEDLAAVAA
jgi:hypothetical protein